MPSLRFQELFDNHPYPDDPCDKAKFVNQCAIRMGVALNTCGVAVTGVEKCYAGLKHEPKHVLRAQELATWLCGHADLVGTVTKHRRSKTQIDASTFAGQKGLIFIRDGWGSTDHIDLWDGKELKGGDVSYLGFGSEVWFWPLS